ncbi:CDP-alcohol phosphatidyltransferase family protein [Candidatus Dojkabacteria bacterium]|nr:CDP-alcohol phosphatidyltransferase family protein [Candidatus Dojkabacteria bacterium]
MLEKLRGPIKPLADFIARYFTWLHPNYISIIGFLLVFVPAYFFIQGKPLLAGLGLILHFFDFLDGAVARYTGKTSIFGEVLDASFDRIADGLIIFSIAHGGFVSWDISFFVLIGFYMVSYVRARTGEAAAKEIKLNVGFAQRGERIIALILASVFYFDKIPFFGMHINTLQIVFVILGLLTWQTAIHRLVVAYRKLNEL